MTVTWHDSCHLGRASGIYEPPRQVIRAIPNINLVEMQHNREVGHCCASVVTLIKDPPVAAEIGKTRLDEALEAGAKKILAVCPCCEVQLRVAAEKKKVPVEIVDLAHLAASTLGYEFPDPNPEVRKKWGVFDAMIVLMTPEGFAKLMNTMWPELIDAMPFGMGKMMRQVHLPGFLNRRDVQIVAGTIVGDAHLRPGRRRKGLSTGVGPPRTKWLPPPVPVWRPSSMNFSVDRRDRRAAS